MIYFDNSATTVPDPSVLDAFLKASTRFFANPSSLHVPGMEAERFLEKARSQLAALCGVSAEEIIFTSGGTESNNLAIKGAARFYKQRGRHIVTTAIEHPSVFEACRALEQEGFRVTYIEPGADGVIRTEDVKQALTGDTCLVTVMHVNNETGAVQPVEDIGRVLRSFPHALFHVDAVQSFGKLDFSVTQAGIDLLSVSGHKLHGLKGTGFLYKKAGIQLEPLLSGGGQEGGLRSGTEHPAGCAALARAARLAFEADMEPVRQVTRWIREQLESRRDTVVHTPRPAAPHILNVSIEGVKGEVLVHALEKEGVIVSTTSACSSKQTKPSRTLQAMRVNAGQAAGAIRISLSTGNTMQEAEQFIDALDKVVPVLVKKRTERK